MWRGKDSKLKPFIMTLRFISCLQVKLQTALNEPGYWAVSDSSLSQAMSQLLVVCADN